MNNQNFTKAVLIYDYSMGISGLLIKYNFNGKDDAIMAPPEETADLFKEHDFIDNYEVRDGRVYIIHNSYPIPWEHFATEFKISRDDAREIVGWIEARKAAEREAKPFNVFAKLGEYFMPKMTSI